jgi:hypothetical protein
MLPVTESPKRFESQIDLSGRRLDTGQHSALHQVSLRSHGVPYFTQKHANLTLQVCGDDHSGSLRSHAPKLGVRVPDMDQQHWMGEPGDLFHYRSREPSLQPGRLGRRHALDRRDAKPIQKRTTCNRNHSWYCLRYGYHLPRRPDVLCSGLRRLVEHEHWAASCRTLQTSHKACWRSLWPHVHLVYRARTMRDILATIDWSHVLGFLA